MSAALKDAQATELAPIQSLSPMIVFAPGGIQPVLDKIASDVRSTQTDVTTPKGRAAIASLAHKVARSKTALDDMGKALTDEWRMRTNAVNDDRRKAREFLDALKDEVRLPLTRYEQAEEARVTAHERALAAIPECDGYGATETIADLEQRLSYLSNPPHREWQEFADKASAIYAAEIARTTSLLNAAKTAKQEADRAAQAAAAEAEQLRQTAERERREREARIAAEAAKSAREEAEARANRAAAEERQRVEREAQAAEAARLASERAAKEAIERAERAEAKAKQDAEAQALAAVDAERQKVAREREAQAAQEKAATQEAERKAADKAHRAGINRQILVGLSQVCKLSEDQGKAVIAAVARGEILHMAIRY